MTVPATTVILVVGLDEFFAHDSVLRGEKRAAAAEHVLANIVSLIDACAATVDLIVTTQLPASAEATFSRFGDRIVQALDARTPDAFAGTDLADQFHSRGITDVVVAGARTSAGVDATARAAYERGFAVTVLADCTADPSTAAQKLFIDTIFVLYAAVVDHAGFLAQLRDGGNAEPARGRTIPADELNAAVQAALVNALEHQERGDLLADPLTGMASRALLEDRAGRALARARRNGTSTALLVVDIDHFHRVNDEYGIAAGDQVLVEVGRRLESAFRVHDTVAAFGGVVGRAGGNEFVVLCEQVQPGPPVVALGERVLDVLQSPVEFEGGSASVSASIGIGVAGPGALRLEELFLRADSARRNAKARGRGQCAVFADDERSRAGRDAERELQQALDAGQFRLVYQPKIDLATDRMNGIEALLRWEHPDRGTVPPLEFIPLAEETGLIVPIGDWVIGEACRQIARWDALVGDRRQLVTAVNVSARQFGPALVDVVAAALGTSGVKPGALCLEVTESMVMTDVEGAVATLQSLADLGVRLSVDDFGTGYSSLAYLKRLPINEVKIDKSFVDGLGRDRDDTAIVAAVTGMSHALDLAVVAEGVETAEQLAQLRTLGCEYVQGYYFSRPVPPNEIDDMLVEEFSSGSRTRKDAGTAGAAAETLSADTVLVIDDAADVRMLARMSLTAAGFEVLEADNGRGGLALAKNAAPDCILLDLLMPDISGVEVCHALRSDPATASCTILMLSGNDDPIDKAAAFGSGVDDYIVKPFSPRDLTSRVHAAMRRRKQGAGAPSAT